MIVKICSSSERRSEAGGRDGKMVEGVSGMYDLKDVIFSHIDCDAD